MTSLLPIDRPGPRRGPALRAVAVALLVGGLGTLAAPTPASARPALGATTTTVPGPATRTAQARALPAAPVVDLATGRTVSLRSVSRGRPIVLWFWAPG